MTHTAAQLPLLLLGLTLPACAPDYARPCIREHGRIEVQDYLAEQGLDDCPDTPDSFCKGRILSKEAAACAAIAYEQQRNTAEIWELTEVVGLAYTRDSVFDDEGLAWYMWFSNGSVQLWTTMWAVTGEMLAGDDDLEVREEDVF